MRKIVLSFFVFFFFILSFCSILHAANEPIIETKKANVIVNGNQFNGVNTYTIHGVEFFALSEMKIVFSARLDWQPVSNKVAMKFQNKSVTVFMNDKKVAFGKKIKKLDTPTLFIKKELYIPVEMFTMKEFEDISENSISFQKKDSLLIINSKSNISAVRYYTKENNTEIVIELDEKMTHTVKKHKNSIILSFQRGKVNKDEIYVDNGAIKTISYDTVGREAVFKIDLLQTPKSVKIQKFKRPLKVVVDIVHSSPVDITKPCVVSIPETIVDSKVDIKNDTDNNAVVSASSDKNIVVQNPVTDTDKTLESENDILPPVINARALEVQSDIYEKPVVEEDDSAELAKIKTVTVTEDQIIDNTYELIDDKESMKDIIPTDEQRSEDAKLILIDAGHGGHDPGAVGPNGTKEKDVNLAIALALKNLFNKDKNYKVILTREDDTFIPLSERTNIANKNKVDLFISVHNNANIKREMSGFEIYFLSENASDSEAAATAALENSVISLEDKPKGQKAVLQNMLWSMTVNEFINESSELASFISGETPKRLKTINRGIKQANFYVLRGAQMPAVLVEGAFISNYSEEAKLNTRNFQLAIADSIYEGVKKYYARKNKINNK
ncbi:N-acetylmuramoyl-L-alanine amidase family protein [Candidatus Ruminimicrobium bovinum]|uniref:N-acetylmuramoyl-L-alanine amidase family protein n=1 Tax=Candidatus Ruminimicrobium bovinum TaxID=3242779 RepID=UPI0039B8CD1A